MLILTIRTDNPQAEVGLFDDEKKLVYKKWQAHRRLSATIHQKITRALSLQGRTLQDLGGLVVFKGPGSFTGLRIGIATANALADSLEIPIIGTNGQNWAEKAIKKLLNNQNDKLVLPEYGQPVKTTPPSA